MKSESIFGTKSLDTYELNPKIKSIRTNESTKSKLNQIREMNQDAQTKL